MKIKFLNPQTLDRNIKATAHKSGKLGFTVEAAKKLGLSNDKSMSIGINEDDANDKNLYVVLNAGKQEDAFAVSKAGQYYYVNTKSLFDALRLDYTTENIVYDIVEEMLEDGIAGYKFKRRDAPKKANKIDDGE